jgi:adenosylcobyric acid synthase
LAGYEIHVGETSYLPGAQPFATLQRSVGETNDACPSLEDGCVAEDQRTFGTYLHGIFDGDAFRHAFLRAAREYYGLKGGTFIDWWGRRDKELDRLAEAVTHAVDLQAIFRSIGLSYET